MHRKVKITLIDLQVLFGWESNAALFLPLSLFFKFSVCAREFRSVNSSPHILIWDIQLFYIVQL